MKEKELTPEQRKQMRDVALKNLNEAPLMDLAAAYLAEKSGQYGEAGNSAIEQFKYLPAIQSSEGSKLMSNSILESRQDGKRYTGNVSEYKIIESCAKIMQESLGAITIQDVLGLIGSDITVNENYKDKYLFDLANSENEKDKEIFQQVMGNYMQYLTDTKVSEALKERVKFTRGGLEEILKPSDSKPQK